MSEQDRSPGIEPVAFTPLDGGKPADRRRLSIAGAVIAALLAGATVVLWFIFTSRALLITTEPDTATTEVDGGLHVLLGDSYLLFPGDYRVTVSAPGYFPITDEVRIGDARSQQLQVELTKKPGNLEVTTPVDGVAVTIDSEAMGDAPGLFEGISPGVHAVSLRHPRYRHVNREVEIRGMELTETLDVEMAPAWGQIAITSEPPGAAITVSGRDAGATPATVEVLESGELVTLSIPGFKSWEKQLSATPGAETESIEVTLEPADATLALSSSPPGARVTVNGQYQGQTPLTLALDPGAAQRIALFLAGYQRQQRTVTLESGENRSLAVPLDAELGQLRINLAPASATLLVDGRETDVVDGVVTLPARPHKLEARLAGYASQSKTVTPKPGIEQQVSFTLVTAADAERRQLPEQTQAANGQTLKLFPPERVAFTMGSSRREQGRRANEITRTVALERLFYVATTPVTNAQFKAFRPLHSSSHAGGKTLDTPSQPVVNVSWNDAALYCNWLSAQEGLTPFYIASGDKITGTDAGSTGYRLPTEAEWAWLARYRGGAMARFPWGDSYPPPTNAGGPPGNYADRSAAPVVGRILSGYDDGFAVTAPVNRFAANDKGMFSMGHNIAEWINDFYGAEPSLGLKTLADPLGPDEGQYHVVRGAGWRHGTITELRLSFRDYGAGKRDDVGFRVARYAQEQ